MAGPPNSVAIAAPIPSNYFASAEGPLAAMTTPFQQSGHVQPIVPVFGTNNPGATFGGPPPIFQGVFHDPISVLPLPRQGAFNLRGYYEKIGNAIQAGDFTNPVSYWQRQIASRRFGRVTINRSR